MDQRFSNDNWHKNVTTVGEMIDELSRLPRDLPIKQDFSNSADLVLFNRYSSDCHLSVDEGGTWSDEGEDEDDEDDL